MTHGMPHFIVAGIRSQISLVISIDMQSIGVGVPIMPGIALRRRHQPVPRLRNEACASAPSRQRTAQ